MNIKGIEQYQFVQNELAKITLNLHTSNELSPNLQSQLQEKISRDIDPGLSLEINPVNEIKRTVSGKHRFVISHCQKR